MHCLRRLAAGLGAVCFGWAALGLIASLAGEAAGAEKPNVILILTDDQGPGDIAALGNAMLKTPHLDRLHAQSVRLTDFHVDPTCSPTRAALMTGRYSSRTGVWHTIMGRSILRSDETTLAQVFASNGYRTAMFGKWHLGDNHPARPHDVGFRSALYHGGGGVGQTPDFFGNDYFDDTYFRNGKPEQFEGYCTDVWFRETLGFIEAQRESDQPFFVYLSTNAAHGPFRVPDAYSAPYVQRGVPQPMANFYGMISNIDHNLGRLMQQLEEWKIAENTILIFMTDNGTAAGTGGNERWPGFNAGLRGKKGSEYEGGHRVPFFIRWPGGGIDGGRDVDLLSAHIDVLPTLAELCALKLPKEGLPRDGASLAPWLTGDSDAPLDRTLFVHSQRIETPRPWRKCAVMTERWRLVNGNELFDLAADRGQKTNVAGEHSETVEELSRAYLEWYASLEPRFEGYARIDVGDPAEDPVRLTCHDWHTNDGGVPWDQSHVRKGIDANGFWALRVARAGRYAITLSRWPLGDDRSLEADMAQVRVGGIERSIEVAAETSRVSFEVTLPAGPTELHTVLRQGERERGAYFVKVDWLGEQR